MNYARIALAGLGGFVVYFVLGGLMFAVLPMLKSERAGGDVRRHAGACGALCDDVPRWIEHNLGRAIWRVDRSVCGLRFCGARLREFEYWRDAYGAASRRLPH